MVVAGAGEGVDGDEAVAARTIFDHDGVAPPGAELFCEQPRAQIGARAGAERENEFHRPNRPILRLGRCGHAGQREREQNDRGADA